MTDPKLNGLQPKFREPLEMALERMRSDPELKSAGVTTVLVLEGLRTLPVQMAYYSRYLASLSSADNREKAARAVQMFYLAAGLYRPDQDEALRPVTWTLDSRHLAGGAADLVPSRDGKTPWWSAPDSVWDRMGLIGKAFGLSWGGDWPPEKQDKPHFEKGA